MIMNSEEARKEEVKVYFKALSRHSAGQTHLIGINKQPDPYDW
jgi:hypothetical protein